MDGEVMKVIVKGVQQGKTYDLLKSYKEGQVIVCPNRAMTGHVKAMAKKMGIVAKIKSVEELRLGQRGRVSTRELLVDNADMILQQFLFPDIVKTVTLNQEGMDE